MSGELVTLVSETDAPMCPSSLPPVVAELHKLHNRTLDAFYGATTKNEDGEFATDEMDKAYYAAVALNHMRLYVDSATAFYHGSMITVECWWWRCQVCGFVLPTEVKR